MQILLTKKSRFVKDADKPMYMTLINSGCLMSLMRYKAIEPLQGLYLLQLNATYYEGRKSARDVAFQIAEMTESLQESMIYIEFPYWAANARDFHRRARREMVYRIMVVALLGDKSSEHFWQPMTYIERIAKELDLKFEWTYNNLYRKAWATTEQLRKTAAAKEHQESLEIIEDALKRSNLTISRYR